MKQLTKPCLHCGKTIIKPQTESLKNWNNRHKYCSRTCGALYRKKNEGWGTETQFRNGCKAINPIKKGQHLSPQTQFKKGQEPWNKGLKDWIVPWNKGKEFTQIKDENHPSWKGDEVGYFALHNWIARKYGKPLLCENCGDTSKTKRGYHWANLDGKYSRNIETWARLCCKCHRLYDLKKLKLDLAFKISR